MMGKLANAVGYQLVWFISVVGAANGLAYVGPLAACVFTILVIACSGNRKADLRLIPLALVIGLLADSAWIALGWLHYSAPLPSPAFAPAWIIGIWVSFALTLNHSMAFLKGRYVLATLLGAVGGPLAYCGGARALGAVHFDAPIPVVVIGLGVGVAWAAIFPLLVRTADFKHEPKRRVALP